MLSSIVSVQNRDKNSQQLQLVVNPAPDTTVSGSIILGNIKWTQLEKAIYLAITCNNSHNDIINYKDTNFSEKVCKIITGYQPIVNKFLWMKDNLL